MTNRIQFKDVDTESYAHKTVNDGPYPSWKGLYEIIYCNSWLTVIEKSMGAEHTLATFECFITRIYYMITTRHEWASFIIIVYMRLRYGWVIVSHNSLGAVITYAWSVSELLLWFSRTVIRGHALFYANVIQMYPWPNLEKAWTCLLFQQ